MNLIVASIPDGHDARALWLERQLTGLHLRELVSELTAVHGSHPNATTLDDVLLDCRDNVLQKGLVHMPAAQFRALFAHPALMFELQDLVFVEGGSYWQSLPLENDHNRSVKDGWNALKKATTRTTKIVRPSFYRRPMFWCSAAAVLLVSVLGIQHFRGPQWGFNNAAIYSNDVAHADYVNRLSKAAGEWFDEKPADRVALAARIGEFKHGCEKLLVAEHAPLTPSERDELLKRCRNWIAQLDKLSGDLAAGRDEGAVRLNTDAIVEKLQTFLKTLA
ncbi:MAG: hypothetical protein WCT04_12595 [Planctomycetota bacterium]